MNVAPRSCVHRRIAAFAGVALVFAFGHVANAAPVGCSQDVLKIDGVPVAVGLCAIKRDPKSIAVTETFTGPGTPGGVVAVQVVDETHVTPVATVTPKANVVAPGVVENPVPVKVTDVPPAYGPDDGVTLVTVGPR